MPELTLIKLEIGTFKGFAESGLEFTAEIVSPYHSEYRPNIGEFIVVTLSRESAVLGRITRFFPMGVLSSGEGDEYLAEMRRRNRAIPEDLKETKLRYTVNVKLLGGLEISKSSFIYHPSIRQLPHLGARVGTLSDEALKFVCALGKGGEHSVSIGNFVLGETVFDKSGGEVEVPVMFDLDHLVARRTFVFARAGYGKTNLIKLLISRLYQLEQPGGMIIFDPEGEYAFRDKRGRPGLADVPFLANKLVVYTNRRVPAPYDRWVAGNVKLNLCDLRPAEVVNQCIAVGKQDAVFANVLRGLDAAQWRQLVELISLEGYKAKEKQIVDITQYSESGHSVVINAISNNLTPVISSLHEQDSVLIRSLREHLSRGRIVIIDISLLSSTNGYRVAGLVLEELFHRNQENFVVGSEGEVIPIIAVLEEAQSILPKGVPDSSPFVTWVKEGRKYMLGTILVTQQPGSIAPELLSQGDNFFAFHLLSVGDLKSLQGNNAHYSDDVLASVLNEPIKGNSYLWSAPDQPFVLPCRIDNFEKWADKLNKEQEQKEKSLETPAEIQRKEMPRRRDKLDALVKDTIDKHRSVAIHPVVELDGATAGNVVAVKMWNLLFALGEALSTEEGLFSEYGRTLPDNSKKILREEACIESLSRLGFFIAKRKVDPDGDFFLLAGEKVNRVAKANPMKITKSLR